MTLRGTRTFDPVNIMDTLKKGDYPRILRF